MRWTNEQRQAIKEKGSNTLVAAAAGSGKTAVLVERIIQKIINDKVDIDSILIVTFTNAAASEMRERILNAIYKKIEEAPNDENLQRQIVLLNKSNICTIHSFCLDVIRNNFFEINISPNFRIGDSAEIELLKQDVLEELFEDKYMNMDKDFLELVNTYTGYRGDEPLKEIILKIYKYIQSSPFPEEWINEKIEMFNIENTEQDFADTLWGRILLDNYRDSIIETKMGLKNVKCELEKNPELDKYYMAIGMDIEKLEEIEANLDSWDKAYNLSLNFAFTKWPIDRKVTSNIKDDAKAKRDKINKKFKIEKDKMFAYSSKEANIDIKEMYKILYSLKNIIVEFSNKFSKKKLEKNIIDFNDIEHFALKILVKKDLNGNYIPTEIAKKYMNKFTEIAIDEYQDSNLVQEYILSTISNGKNIFMVGDVKQSIYKFRQARPELFLEKYNNYKLKDMKKEKEKDGLKIQLFKNFRSRKNILDVTNIFFQDLMSTQLGDIDYNEIEYLNLGADYKDPEETNFSYAGNAQLDIINLKKEELEEIELVSKDSNYEFQDEMQEEQIENTVLEAKYVAKKIENIINSNYKVYDKNIGYRSVKYKDIVILLRSTAMQSPIYEKELSNLGIPVFSDTSSEYLNSIEIQTIMSVLKIIDNPMQDIPLVTVLRSSIGGFSDNELIKIRLSDKYSNFYEALIQAKLNIDQNLKNKIDEFLNKIDIWREKQEYLSLDELIWQIYIDTGYYNYVGLMPNGNLRQANLKMLFERAKQYESASFKGLFNFINFIEKLKLSSGDLSSAKIIGENEDVVRIMSIHKSKGLEFPIVFLCGCGKQFNMQDLNDNILLHQDLGFGPEYINYEKRIEYTTLAKEAIKQKIKTESLSEELRVLYVALTRAKEKIILTGVSKDVKKDLKEKEELLNIYDKIKGKIHPSLVGKYNSYLDWIELVYLNNPNIEDILNMKIIQKEDLLKEFSKYEHENKEVKSGDIYDLMKRSGNKDNKQILNILNWKYSNLLATTIPSKMSVTKIKEIKMEKESVSKDFKFKITAKPMFLNQTETLSKTEKGTIMHLCLQKLDIRYDYSKKDIENFVCELVSKKLITEKEAESVDIDKLYLFTKNDLWIKMKKAMILEREKPFYIDIDAQEIYDQNSEEKVLVQGIIDAYFISQDGKITLVDYKTDYVPNNDENTLKQKYKEQLKIYKTALEKALKKNVDEVYIYSTYLNKQIKI